MVKEENKDKFKELDKIERKIEIKKLNNLNTTKDEDTSTALTFELLEEVCKEDFEKIEKEHQEEYSDMDDMKKLDHIMKKMHEKQTDEELDAALEKYAGVFGSCIMNICEQQECEPVRKDEHELYLESDEATLENVVKYMQLSYDRLRFHNYHEAMLYMNVAYFMDIKRIETMFS